MSTLEMPVARDFGWTLKQTSSSSFDIHQRSNGQFCVVLNHALLRGVDSQMLFWWFLHFPRLRVQLIDIPKFKRTIVPSYLLWHPCDHYDATLSGRVGPRGTSCRGAKLRIRESMQYDRYGWKYPVDTKVKIFYVGPDGWSMGKVLPGFCPVMMLRIHFKDVEETDGTQGVHYHYEVVIGTSKQGRFAKHVNNVISKRFGPDFFEAWHRHNVIEVGTFENFLPNIYAQRHQKTPEFRISMDSAANYAEQDHGFDRALFETRMDGYRSARNPSEYQAYDEQTFI